MLLWDLLGKFPGTDYESFNYDWIIGKLKELKDSVAAALASEEAADESASNASGAAGFAMLYRNAAKDFRDEAEGFANDAQDSAESIADVTEQVYTNTGRIDNLIANAGDGTIPSELVDVRTENGGLTASTAGNAVRDQENANRILSILAMGGKKITTTWTDGYLDTSDNVTEQTGNKEKYSEYIDIPIGHAIVAVYKSLSSNTLWARFNLYDSNNTLLTNVTPGTGTAAYLAEDVTANSIRTWVIYAGYDNNSSTNVRKTRLSYRTFNNSTMELYLIPAANVPGAKNSLPALLMGDTNHPAVVEVNTNKSTITIPGDTLIMSPRSNTFFNFGYAQDYSQTIQISPLNSPVVLDYSSQSASTALAIVYNTNTETCAIVQYRSVEISKPGTILLAVFRHSLTHKEISISINAPVTINGGVEGDTRWKGSPNVKSINHRGYNDVAPENTLPAFTLSKLKGFDTIECDIQKTSDDVPVVLHDGTINRTARDANGDPVSGTVNIYDITYSQSQTYDFGIWKGQEYAGTKIPTWEQLCSLSRNIALEIWCEIKSESPWTQADIDNVVEIGKKYGLKVVYISMSVTLLGMVKTADPDAEVWYVTSTIDSTEINKAVSVNAEGIDVARAGIDTNGANAARSAGLKLGAWTVDDYSRIRNMNPYVTHFTNNRYIAEKVLYDFNI